MTAMNRVTTDFLVGQRPRDLCAAISVLLTLNEFLNPRDIFFDRRPIVPIL